MKGFQIILLGIFGFFIVAGVITFATIRSDSEGSIEPVTIWGTLEEADIRAVVVAVNEDLSEKLRITYIELREDEFEQELIEALASGEGPDLMFLSQDLILRHSDKVAVIPYESFPERNFKDRFIEEGELYLTPEGTIGLPFSVDPLVMYWNRSLFSNAGIAEPPKFWDEFFQLAQTLTEKDDRGNILKSAVALGTFDNITNAKEIITAMMLQSGTPIVVRRGEGLEVVLRDTFGFPSAPAVSSLRFYTEFADPATSIHSWDRSRPFSKQAFVSGDLAIYFGFASELFELRQKNPNLNFDVALIPQVSTSARDTTYGHMFALSVLKNSSKQGTAFQILGHMTGATAISAWEDSTGLPPVRRDLLSQELDVSADAFRTAFRRSALIAQAFLDPDREETSVIFQDMVEGVISGRSGLVSNAVDAAHARLEALVR